ncbi:MAG: hypothetical protein QF645_11010, partial [Planctomycetota bacterium]|nr:hypothetical protein [Planctomycetota bacterium]
MSSLPKVLGHAFPSKTIYLIFAGLGLLLGGLVAGAPQLGFAALGIALFAALAALSFAPSMAHAGAATAIEADRAAGLITDHEARMQTFAVVFA